MSEFIRIATRQSPLALWQAHSVRDLLQSLHPDLHIELLPMTTKGDREQSTSLAKIGGKGLFLKELETALLENTADLAVHSMKDVTAQMPDGLVISTVLERHNPHDALVSNHYNTIEAIPDNAVIGTCSPRRQAQLLTFNPTFKIVELRGNVGTRLGKLDAGDFDATVLACAGLERLGLDSRIAQSIPAMQCLPAVTQGTIGIEIRESDNHMKQLLAPLNHQPTAIRTEAERAFSAKLNGGCSAPIAAYATIDSNEINLTGRVIALDGSELLEASGKAPLDQAAALGVKLAIELLEKGAQDILNERFISLSDKMPKTRVLVTRPKHQQSLFLKSCDDAGLETVTLPCIDILPVECKLTNADIKQSELVLFTSRNAVEFAHAIHPLPWKNAKVYAIGRATQRVLSKLGQALVHPPVEPYSSEAFLDWYKTQTPIKSALIVKGMCGRDLIESQLEASGVNVVIKSVYKRVIPVVSDSERQRVFVETPPDIISITSDDVLRNLVNIAGPAYASVLHSTQLVVNSERCADMAVRLGFDHRPRIAYPPGDVGQMAAILDCIAESAT